MSNVISNPSPLVLVPRRSGERTVGELAAFVRAHSTVTMALERWCHLTGLGDGPLEARVLSPMVAVEPSRELTAELALAGPGGETPATRVMLRHVGLMQGQVMLVEALNWFVPDRLPADVARQLALTTIPFGRLIGPLGGHRSEVREVPLTSHDAFVFTASRALFQQRAVVCDRANVRLAVVQERFLPALLGGHDVALRDARV